MRKTKIICTLGPSTDDDDILRRLMIEGMNVARFNFSHGDHAQHKRNMERIMKFRTELNLPVATLLDTKGPEIRLVEFEKGKTVKKLEKIGNSKKTGTKVRFLADDTIFETQEFDYDVLETRFREMAFLTKGLKITFEDKRNPEKQKKVEFCFEGGLKSFVEYLNKNKEND